MRGRDRRGGRGEESTEEKGGEGRGGEGSGGKGREGRTREGGKGRERTVVRTPSQIPGYATAMILAQWFTRYVWQSPPLSRDS